MPTFNERVRSAWRGLVEGIGAFGTGIDPDEDLYRRVTSGQRDLSPLNQDRAREVAFYLWERNPMAKRITEMLVDFIVGDGIVPSAPDERVQEWIGEFWNDPIMGLPMRQHDFVRDQSLAGELILRHYANPISGRGRLGFIDPARISRVVKHPQNLLIDRWVYLRGEMGEEPAPLDCVWYDDETEPGSPRWAGDTFYFGINRPTGARRGRPDLLALSDWVDGYDQMLWNVVDRSGFQNAFVWDVTLTGAGTAQVNEWIRDHAVAPKPGTVRAHNEKEVWNAVSPDLGAAQMETAGRMVKNYALGGAGLPEGWFADGDSANRATLTAQSDPTYRMLKRRQGQNKALWEAIFTIHVWQGIQHGALPSSVDPTVVVNLTDPSETDVQGVAGALPGLTDALLNAVAEEYVSKKSARRIWLTVAGMIGVDLDMDEEEQQIEDEQAEAEAEEAANPQSDPSALALAALQGTDPQPDPTGAADPQDPAEA